MPAEVIEIFGADEGPNARGIKRKMLIIWIVCTSIVFAVILTLALVDLHRVNAYYDRTYHTLFTVAASVIIVLFCGGSLFFFAVPFRLVRDTVKMHDGFAHGDRETAEVKFIEKSDTLISKDGIEFYSIKVETKPLRRGDITERQVLIERTKVLPGFTAGQRLRLTTHASILINYTVLETDSQLLAEDVNR